ncbi:MAG: 4-alpha-glucanotransferase, partial [Oscillospiraceae bacterium]|nr:4-alpha-glucanotransferase [Oscillospiraceae bacterium]
MRASGILMHITSLPGPYGVGTMGKEAFRFVDFMKDAGQKYWQILPLTPTGYGDSPYQSCSTYAGNPYLIDLDKLIEDGLLEKSEVAEISWNVQEDKTDFGLLYNNREKVLRLAYGRFAGGEKFEAFCQENSRWLADFSLFMALKGKYGGKPWYEWDRALKFREPNALWDVRHELADEIRFYSFVQYLFQCQWEQLRAYAAEADIKIIGDVPIYVPLDSADVWSNPELFQLDAELDPTAVAGCPPDAFTADGQLWGNPMYRWEKHVEDGFAWWMSRLSSACGLFDALRIDHFRGF